MATQHEIDLKASREQLRQFLENIAAINGSHQLNYWKQQISGTLIAYPAAELEELHKSFYGPAKQPSLRSKAITAHWILKLLLNQDCADEEDEIQTLYLALNTPGRIIPSHDQDGVVINGNDVTLQVKALVKINYLLFLNENMADIQAFKRQNSKEVNSELAILHHLNATWLKEQIQSIQEVTELCAEFVVRRVSPAPAARLVSAAPPLYQFLTPDEYAHLWFEQLIQQTTNPNFMPNNESIFLANLARRTRHQYTANLGGRNIVFNVTQPPLYTTDFSYNNLNPWQPRPAFTTTEFPPTFNSSWEEFWYFYRQTPTPFAADVEQLYRSPISSPSFYKRAFFWLFYWTYFPHVLSMLGDIIESGRKIYRNLKEYLFQDWTQLKASSIIKRFHKQLLKTLYAPYLLSVIGYGIFTLPLKLLEIGMKQVGVRLPLQDYLTTPKHILHVGLVLFYTYHLGAFFPKLIIPLTLPFFILPELTVGLYISHLLLSSMLAVSRIAIVVTKTLLNVAAKLAKWLSRALFTVAEKLAEWLSRALFTMAEKLTEWLFPTPRNNPDVMPTPHFPASRQSSNADPFQQTPSRTLIFSSVVNTPERREPAEDWQNERTPVFRFR